MGKIAQECPFCGERLTFDTLRASKGCVRSIVQCDNDDCSVQPCTEYGTPSKVIEEAKFFGNKDDHLNWLKNNDCCYNCKNNKNNFSINYACNCLFESKKNNYKQHDYCDDYEEMEK